MHGWPPGQDLSTQRRPPGLALSRALLPAVAQGLDMPQQRLRGPACPPCRNGAGARAGPLPWASVPRKRRGRSRGRRLGALQDRGPRWEEVHLQSRSRQPTPTTYEGVSLTQRVGPAPVLDPK